MENTSIQNILDKVATACTCDEKIYRNYRQTFQTIYSYMSPLTKNIRKFQDDCSQNLLWAMEWGETAVVAQCKLEIYSEMFSVLENAILQGEHPSFHLSKFKEYTIDKLCHHNGTSTSVLSNAVDHCHRLAIQSVFLGGHNVYNQISHIVQREQEQA